MIEIEWMYDDQYIIHDKANPMPCGHPRGCIVQDEEGTAHCAWCEEMAGRNWSKRMAEARWATLVEAANALVQRLAALNLQKPEAIALGNAMAYGPEVTALQDILENTKTADTVKSPRRELIPDASMLHRLVYAAEMWWEGQGEQSQQDIAAGYALVEKIRAAAGDATDEEEGK